MNDKQVRKIAGPVAIALLGCVVMSGQELPFEPAQNAGTSITGALEGWFPNSDGTFSILLGYYNRNLEESMDIPIGPNNHIDPGGPDQGQPTHFLPGRQWGIFTITVPKDFKGKGLKWTIVANGKSTVIPADLNDLWVISPFIDAIGNTPPVLSFKSFDQNGPSVKGPLPLVTKMTATVGVPLTLDAWVADDNKISPGRKSPAHPITVGWSVFRGPGTVTFANAKPSVEPIASKLPEGTTVGGKVSTMATFSAPGEYVLYLMVNDATGVGGGGGFQCCWTNGHVSVSVKPSDGK